jgi:hypothetical protein
MTRIDEEVAEAIAVYTNYKYASDKDLSFRMEADPQLYVPGFYIIVRELLLLLQEEGYDPDMVITQMALLAQEGLE